MNNFAATPTMVPSPKWVDMDDHARLTHIQILLAMSGLSEFYLANEAKSNGHVIVEFRKPFSAADRGTVLLNLEEFLKERVDPGITIWLAPLGDRSSLRNLRGIEMK